MLEKYSFSLGLLTGCTIGGFIGYIVAVKIIESELEEMMDERDEVEYDEVEYDDGYTQYTTLATTYTDEPIYDDSLTEDADSMSIEYIDENEYYSDETFEKIELFYYREDQTFSNVEDSKIPTTKVVELIGKQGVETICGTVRTLCIRNHERKIDYLINGLDSSYGKEVLQK